MRLPETKNTPLVRVDFADHSAWDLLCQEIQAPVGEFRAHVDCISLRELAGATPEQVVQALPEGSHHDIVLIADAVALGSPEHAVLVVDVAGSGIRSFRVVPAHAWSVENNLSVANMDFHEFADATDPDGVFRGFPESQ